MPERDPLQPLHEAWQHLDAPPSTRPLSEEDDVTQSAVNWMTAAWQQVDIPSTRFPRRSLILRLGKWTLAAAAVLLISTWVLWPERQPGDLIDSHTVVQVNPPKPVDAEPASPNADLQMPAAADANLQTSVPAPRLIASTDQKVEILSGTVRLTMLRSPSASTPTLND